MPRFSNAAVLSISTRVDACIGRDPVHLPSLSAIVRKRLLRTARIRSDLGDHKSNEDGSAIQCFLIEELATAINELADGGLTQYAIGAVGRIEAPLVGLRIARRRYRIRLK